MGLIQKKESEEHEVIEGVEIIERSDVPDDLESSGVDVVTRDGEPEADEKPVEPAASDEPTDASDASDGGADRPRGPRPALIVAGLIIVAVIAAIGGYFVGSGGFAAEGAGAPGETLTEDQLDTVVASYTYNGVEHEVTAREALESEYSLATIQNTDGTYNTPSANTVLSYVRNQVTLADAESRGIEVTDDEAASFAESSLGTSDYSEIAETYGVTEDQAQTIVHDQAMISKLYEQIAPATASITAPTEPTAPADGNEDTASAEYASYIINLAGDEWDSATGTWARTDGEYYAVLGSQSFTADSATYAQAMQAYYVAYQAYVDQLNEISSTISSYANGILGTVDLTLYGIYQ